MEEGRDKKGRDGGKERGGGREEEKWKKEKEGKMEEGRKGGREEQKGREGTREGNSKLSNFLCINILAT